MISHQFCGAPIDMETSIYRKPDFPTKINHPAIILWYPHIYQNPMILPVSHQNEPWMDMTPGIPGLGIIMGIVVIIMIS